MEKMFFKTLVIYILFSTNRVLSIDDPLVSTLGPLEGLNSNSKFLKNVLFTTEAHKNLNFKYWLLNLDLTFGKFAENVPQFLREMKIYLRESSTATLFAHQYSGPIDLQLAELFSKLLSTQFEKMEQLRKKIETTYQTVIAIENMLHFGGTRQARSILPLDGVFHFLFNSVSQNQVNSLAAQMASLQTQNEEFAHFAETQVTALNTTFIEVKANREKIYDLEVYHEEVYSDLFNRSLQTDQYVSILAQFVSDNSQNVELINSG